MKKKDLYKMLKQVDADCEIKFVKTFVGPNGKLTAKEFEPGELIEVKGKNDTVWIKLDYMDNSKTLSSE